MYAHLLFAISNLDDKGVTPFLTRAAGTFARPLGRTARSMRDKAEQTMSRERSHAGFIVVSCAAVLVTLLGVAGISRSVLSSSAGGEIQFPAAGLGDASAARHVPHTHGRCADVRIVGAGLVPREATEGDEWWLGYPLGEQVDDVPTHYSHIMRNFVPSVLRCTAVNGPGACYNVHVPLARLRAAGKGKDALIRAVTTEVASLVNNATVRFVDSGEDDVDASRRSSSRGDSTNGALGRRGGPRRRHDAARMCKADDTSPTSLYGPLRRIAKRNREDAETQKKCDGPEVVHVTRGDVDAIAREFNVPDVEHLTDDELLARKVRAVTNPAEVNKFLNRWAKAKGWRFGFGSLDGKSVAEQREMFCNARVVFGVHGAGLTNVLWAGSTHTRWLIDVPPGDGDWFGDVCDANGIKYVRSNTGHLTKDASYATQFEGDAVALVGWTRVSVRGLERDMERAGVGVEDETKDR